MARKCKVFDNPYVAAIIIVAWTIGFIMGMLTIAFTIGMSMRVI